MTARMTGESCLIDNDKQSILITVAFNIYYFLNIPGIFEQTGSIIIMIIGILCCLGAVCGSVVVDNRIDDRLERGHLFGYY